MAMMAPMQLKAQLSLYGYLINERLIEPLLHIATYVKFGSLRT